MTWVNSLYRTWGISKSRKSAAGRRPLRNLNLTPLEDRVTPAFQTWTGAVNANWSDAGNWSGAIAAGDDLIFPGGAATLSPVNDFAGGTTFASISVLGAGYNLSGNAVAVTAGLSATYGAGTSTSTLDVALGNGAVDVASGGRLDLAGDVSGSAGLNLTGGGTLGLTGASTYTGDTTINAGVLDVDGSIVSPVVLAGGSLTGSGTLNGAGISGSAATTVDPGSVGGAGILTYANGTGFTLPSATTFHVDLNGVTVGTGYDQLKLTNGSALFNPNGADLDISLGYLPAVNTSFQIVSQAKGSPITGRFNGISQFGSVTSGPVTFSVGYFSSGVIITVTAVNVATRTWTGGDADDSLWSSPDNWASGIAPGFGDRLVFASGAARASSVNDFAAGTTFHSIEIQSAGFNFFGNSIQLVGGVTATHASGTSTIGMDLALTANQTINVAAGGGLVLAGQVSGAFGVTKTGEGALAYTGSGANSYTGTTTVNGGTLVLNKTGVNAMGGNLIVGDGTGGETVQLAGDDQIPDAATVTVNEGATFDLNGRSETFATLVLQGTTVAIAAGQTLTLTSGLTTVIAASHAAATIAGPGVLDLGGNPTFALNSDHDGFHNGTINVDAEIGAVIQNGGIVKSGSGIVGLSGANIYAGDTAVYGGAIQVKSDTGLGTPGVTTVASGASVYFNGPALVVDEEFVIAGTGFISSGALTVVSGSATLTGTVTLTGNSQIGAAPAATLTITGAIDDGGSTFDLTVFQGANGRTILSGANLFNGTVTVSGGFLRVTTDDALGNPASASVVSVLSGASLELAGGITLPATKTIAISGVPVSDSSKIMSLSGDNTIQGDIGITGGNNVAFDVAAGTTLQVAGVISGPRDFDKNGAGTLILSGVNTHTGNVNVGDGTLIVNGSLATSNLVFVDGTLGGTGTLPAVTVSAIGTLAPGVGPGLLNTGDVSFTNGTTFSVELNGTTVGTQYDQANVAGTVDLAGATLTIALDATPPIGTTYTIISNDGIDAITGTFNGLPEGSSLTIGVVTLTISYIGGSGNDVVLTVADVSYTWTGADNGDRDWANPGNWVGGIVPTAGSRLFFPVNPVRTESVNSFSPGTVFHSVIILGSGYDIYGNPFAVQNGIATTYAAGTSSLGLGITLLGDQSVDVAAGGTLAVTEAISGAFSLTKVGAGVLRFEHANTYTGGTTVLAGRLALTAPADIGSGVLTINPGATLDLLGNVNLANTITIGGTGVSGLGAVQSSSSTNTLSGNVTLSADTLFQTSTSLNVFGAIGGPFGISTIGPGTFNLLGTTANTYTGTTTAGGNFFVVAKAPGVAAIPGNLVITAGSTFVAQSDNQIVTSAAVTLSAATATFDLDGFSATIGSLTFTGGSVTTGAGMLTLSSGGSITTNGSSSTATLSGHLAFGGPNNFFLVAQGATPGGVDLAVSAVVSSIFNIIKDGAGTMALSGANTYSGGTNINAGVLAISQGTGAGTGVVNVLGTGTLDISGSISVYNFLLVASSGTAVRSSAGANTVGGNVFLATNSTIEVAAFSTLHLATMVNDFGNGSGLTTTGTGTVQLSGTNAYGGGTTITAGNLQVFSAQATGTMGTVALATGTTLLVSTPTYTLPSGGLQLAAGSTFAVPVGLDVTLNGVLTLTADALLNVASAGTLAVTDAIGGAFGLTKTGEGTLTLVGTSSYTGATVVAVGMLRVDGDIASSSGVVVGVAGALSGIGTVGAVTVSGGLLAPGVLSGTLHTGAVTLGNASTFLTVLGGTTAATGYGQLVAEAVDLGGASLQAILGIYTPSPGDTLRIIDNAGLSAVSNTFGGLPEGSTLTLLGYTFRISYVGGDGNDVTLTNIAGTTTTVTTSAATSVYGQPVTLTAVVAAATGTATGTVSFFAGGTLLGTAAVTTVGGSQVATFTTAGLPVGTAVITAVYNGTSIYSASSVTLSGGLTINPAATATHVTSTGTSTYGQGVTFTVQVSAVAPGAGLPAGVVRLFDGATLIATGTADASGAATFEINTLAALGSPHAITAVFTPADGNFTGSTSPAYSQTVNKATLTVTATDRSRVYGGTNPTLAATVTGFVLGQTLATSGVTGAAALSTAATPMSPVVGGPYAITAAVGTLAAGNYDFVFVGGQLAVTPAVLTVTADNKTRAFGESNPTLTVTFAGFKNGETLGTSGVTGTAALSTTATPTSAVAGNPYPITATGGTLAAGNYTFVTLNGQFTVTKATTAAAVTTSGTPSAFGQAVTLSATVARGTAGVGTPTGSITFSDGGVPLGTVALTAGAASLTTTRLGVGVHAITVTYSGDANFVGSESPAATQVVNNVDTTTVVTTNGPTAFGVPQTLTAAVTAPDAATPTGTVTFFDGSTTLGTAAVDATGVATLVGVSLSTGTHAITAVYAGNATLTDSTSAAVTFTVSPAGTAVALASSANPVPVTRSVTFTATVTNTAAGSSAVPTGSVTFRADDVVIGTVALTAGGASLTTALLGVGSHAITVAYSGDANFVGSVSPAATQVVNRVATTTAVVGTGPALFGTPQTLTAAVTAPGAAPPTGTVTFFDGGTELGTATVDAAGTATLVGMSLSTGPHAITAVYAGDATLTGSTSAAVTFTVSPAGTAVALASSANPVPVTRSVTFTATVTNTAAGSSAVPTGSVTFRADDVVIGTVALTAGVATLTTTALPAGTPVVSATFMPTADFTAGTASLTQTILSPVAGDVNGDRIADIVVGPAGGGQPVTVISGADGSVLRTYPVADGFTGEVRTASADVNGDGVADVVTGTGPGVRPMVRVLDGVTGRTLFEVMPFEAGFTGGVYVATGDVTGDGVPDLIVTPDEGGGPVVVVYDGARMAGGTGAAVEMTRFLGIDDPAFRGGARAAVGDVNGDGVADVVVAAGFGGGPRVAVYDGQGFAAAATRTRLVPDFFAFEPGLRNGVYVAVGDFNGDGLADLAFGGGPGGGPRVRIADAATILASGDFKALDAITLPAAQLGNFFVGDAADRGGVRVAVKDLDGDNRADLVVGSGTGSGSRVTAYAGATIPRNGTPPESLEFDAFDDLGGVFVG
ncbi:Ig-like domain repeat protein [Limnoglobus roseus]|uniref:AIDA autotransporter-like protein n=1 Tax=Limnoglobus roseus TaxID=2598579 RepID=A0A5C1AGG1_9BACT|nr:Ig-like domain repeat protein [Limnoglobus roseus]QEL16832.1 AIDA autotransporter-like protein [Limnoglobus roseus]